MTAPETSTAAMTGMPAAVESTSEWYLLFTGMCLVAFAPCGCWSSVQLQDRDLAERAGSTAEFLLRARRSGKSRVEEMPHEQWKALRNGVNGDLKWDCDHEPRWGGAVSTHEWCPRCGRQVKKRKDGGLYAHEAWGYTCSQEPLR